MLAPDSTDVYFVIQDHRPETVGNQMDLITSLFLQQKFFIESADLYFPLEVFFATNVDCNVTGRWV